MPHETPATATLVEQDSAKYIGYSTAYLRVARRRGIGPAYIRIGRSIRYRLEDLDDWLRAHRIEPRQSR